jgi:uncharacterized protein
LTWYCDTSALVKLLADEVESSALAEFARAPGRTFITSQLSITELTRALRRKNPGNAASPFEVFEFISKLAVSRVLLEAAGELLPVELRTLDAIHLASALSLGTDCEGIVSYDIRLQRAARSAGLDAVAPGQA